MKKPKTPRRGTIAVLASFAAVAAPLIASLTEGAVSEAEINALVRMLQEGNLNVPIIAVLSAGVAIYLIEKFSDIRLASTRAAIQKAVADGTVTPQEIGSTVAAVGQDVGDEITDLFTGGPQTDPASEYDPATDPRPTPAAA